MVGKCSKLFVIVGMRLISN